VAAPSGQPTGLDAGTAETTIDHATAPEDPMGRPPPQWSSPQEALVLIARGYTGVPPVLLTLGLCRFRGLLI